LQQLANEALEIGKILGVTVVQHERAAKAKDTKISRKSKAPLTQKVKARSRRQEDTKK